jgi:hypothetical protein
MKRILHALLIVLLAASAWAGQSLAELAKKERERRKKLEGEKPEVITESELRAFRGEPTRATGAQRASDETSEEDEASSPSSPSSGDAPEDPRRTESYWRSRLKPIDDRIREMEAELASPLYTSNLQGGPARQRLERQLEQARRDRQAVIDEARRAGVPPGWVR